MATHSQRQDGGTADIAQRLTELGFLGLFEQQDDSRVRELWQERGTRQALHALALDDHADGEARFLAAEVLFARDRQFPSAQDRAALAALYAQALKQNYTLVANRWGMPGINQGDIGEHVVSLGEAMVPAFEPLLEDEQQVHYEGSEESTIGAIYAFRIKDIAGSLIAAEKKRPFKLERDPAVRDQTIADLKQRLR